MVAAVLLAALLPHASSNEAGTRVSFTESFRYEMLAREEFNGSTTESVSGSKFRIRGQVELSPRMTTRPEDEFSIKVGEGRFSAPLGALAREGKRRYDILGGSASETARPVLATVKLQLKGRTLGFDVESKSFGSSLVGEIYKDSDSGRLEGIAKVLVGTAGIEESLSIPFKARVNTVRRSSGDATGTVTTAEIKG